MSAVAVGKSVARAGIRWAAILIMMLQCFAGGMAWADPAAFEANCARCHPRAKTLARSLKGQNREERAAALSSRLESHHCDDADVRAKIVDYLVGLSLE